MEKGIEIIEKLRGTFLVNISFLNMIDFLPILIWFVYKELEKKMDVIHDKRNEFFNSLLDEFRHNKISGLKSNGTTLIELCCLFRNQNLNSTQTISSKVLCWFVFQTLFNLDVIA